MIKIDARHKFESLLKVSGYFELGQEELQICSNVGHHAYLT